jgi:hypothetical protein
MVFLVSLLAFIAVVAGVFGVGLGVPIHESVFGAAMLTAGSVAITGGFILVGLAATLRELRRVVQGSKAPQSAMPRPVRPLERRDGERVESAERWTEPRPHMPAGLGTASSGMVPAKFDAPDPRERWLKSGRDEWLRRAMAEIDSTQRRADTAPSPLDYAGDLRRRQPNSWPRPPAIPHASDHAETNMRRPSAAPPHDIFDTIWPAEHRAHEEMPEPRTEPLPETGFRPADLRPTEAKSPPLAPGQPVAPASTSPARLEPRPAPILKSGMIQQMAYTLFTDGSIEAQMSEGIMHFASIEEFRRHLENSES